MTRKGALLFILCVTTIILLSSCARVPYPGPENVQTGLASWYGPKFHGKETSNKEIFNMHDMTAAHRTLPFGTYVMVTNLDNDKSVTVRINDRGPFVKGRIIDLSYAAARMLDMIEPGVIPVRIEILPGQILEKGSQRFSVQVGSFMYKKNAEAVKTLLQKKYKNVYISLFKTSHQTYFRVRVKTNSLDEAHKIAQKLLHDGYPVLVLEE